MSENPKAPYVDWPEHSRLVSRVAVQESRLQDIINNFGGQLNKAAQEAEATRKELTDHRLTETKNWSDIFTQLKSIDDKVKHPMVPAGQEKARIERYGWKLIGLMGVVPIGLYYILMIGRLLH